MKKSTRILTALACVALAALLLLGLFAGCSAKAEIGQPRDMDYVAPPMSVESYYDRSEKEIAGDWSNVYAQNAINYSTTATSLGGATGGESDGRFVIATADISIQTKTYDAFTAALKAQLKAMGGYTNAYDEWNYDSDRRASVVARVPSQKLDAFLGSLEENGTVISRSVNTNDVTDEMIETGSKKEALLAEEKALLAILEKAVTVEDIIRVQDRLSNVRAELQAYSQKLQSLQNQVAYSTVRIDVSEVNRITVPTQKFSALASSGFLSSLRGVGNGLRNFALWFISAIPYLVMLAVPTVILVWLVKRVRKNRKAKKAGMQA